MSLRQPKRIRTLVRDYAELGDRALRCSSNVDPIIEEEEEVDVVAASPTLAEQEEVFWDNSSEESSPTDDETGEQFDGGDGLSALPCEVLCRLHFLIAGCYSRAKIFLEMLKTPEGTNMEDLEEAVCGLWGHYWTYACLYFQNPSARPLNCPYPPLDSDDDVPEDHHELSRMSTSSEAEAADLKTHRLDETEEARLERRWKTHAAPLIGLERSARGTVDFSAVHRPAAVAAVRERHFNESGWVFPPNRLSARPPLHRSGSECDLRDVAPADPEFQLVHERFGGRFDLDADVHVPPTLFPTNQDRPGYLREMDCASGLSSLSSPSESVRSDEEFAAPSCPEDVGIAWQPGFLLSKQRQATPPGDVVKEYKVNGSRHSAVNASVQLEIYTLHAGRVFLMATEREFPEEIHRTRIEFSTLDGKNLQKIRRTLPRSSSFFSIVVRFNRNVTLRTIAIAAYCPGDAESDVQSASNSPSGSLLSTNSQVTPPRLLWCDDVGFFEMNQEEAEHCERRNSFVKANSVSALALFSNLLIAFQVTVECDYTGNESLPMDAYNRGWSLKEASLLSTETNKKSLPHYYWPARVERLSDLHIVKILDSDMVELRSDSFRDRRIFCSRVNFHGNPMELVESTAYISAVIAPRYRLGCQEPESWKCLVAAAVTSIEKATAYRIYEYKRKDVRQALKNRMAASMV